MPKYVVPVPSRHYRVITQPEGEGLGKFKQENSFLDLSCSSFDAYSLWKQVKHAVK